MQYDDDEDWILAISSVRFDIDQGQEVEAVFPPNALSLEEQSAVAFHSFPDSLSQELHYKSSIRDSLFVFRTKRVPSSPESSPERAADQHAGHYDHTQSAFLYG